MKRTLVFAFLMLLNILFWVSAYTGMRALCRKEVQSPDRTMCAPATEPKTVYRIVTEMGLIERQPASTYTEGEKQAIARLKADLSRWPQMLWLVSIDGRLTLVKMGPDGKPLGGNNQ